MTKRNNEMLQILFMSTSLWINEETKHYPQKYQTPRVYHHHFLAHIKITNKTIQVN